MRAGVACMRLVELGRGGRISREKQEKCVRLDRDSEKERQERIEAISLAGGIAIAASVVIAGIFSLGRYLGKW